MCFPNRSLAVFHLGDMPLGNPRESSQLALTEPLLATCTGERLSSLERSEQVRHGRRRRDEGIIGEHSERHGGRIAYTGGPEWVRGSHLGHRDNSEP